MTHLCSVKVTHLKNRISVGSVIHAAGVCGCTKQSGRSISSAPKARLGSWFVGVKLELSGGSGTLEFIAEMSRTSLLSGYKMNRFSWLELSGNSSWESNG